MSETEASCLREELTLGVETVELDIRGNYSVLEGQNYFDEAS